MRKIISFAANYIATANSYTKDQKERIEYAMKIMCFETLKCFGIIIIFSILGYPVQAVTAALTMAMIKTFIGGYHEDKQITCFLATIIIIGSVIYLSVNVKAGFIAKAILFFVCIFCIWNQAPIVNPSMPITRDELLRRNRNVGTAIAIIYALTALILHNYIIEISNTILWITIYQVLLMFDKKILKN